MPLSDMPVPGYAPPPTPEAISPPMRLMGGFPLEEENPVSMQNGTNGGLVEEASMLQQAGRGGDNMLVHMNPEEVNALNQMGNAGLGGLQQAQMTINPQTGLPEMFKFKDILPTIIGIGATMSGLGPVAAGLAAGGTSMVTTKGDLGRSLMAGLGAWGGAELGNVLGGSASLNAAGGQAANFGSATAADAGIKLGAEGFTDASIQAANRAGTDLIAMGGKDATQAAARDLAGRSLFQSASPGMQGDMIMKGFGNVAPKWTATKAGEIGLSQLAKPGLATVAGTMGSMPPPPIPGPEEPEPYEEPPPADYGFTGLPPEGYRPGIDPEYDYFRFANDGGYVNNLPTVHARSGMMDDLMDNRLARGLGSAGEKMYDTFLPYMSNPFRQEDVAAAAPEEEEEMQRRAQITANQLPTVNAKFGWKDAAGILSPAYMMHKADLGALTGGIIPSFLYDKFRSDDDNQPAPPAEEEVSEEQARALMSGMGSGMGMNYQMEGGTRGDVVLPTVNAKFGLKDLGMAVSPAYALGRGGIKGLLSRFSPAYMLAKGRYGPEEEEPIDPEDIDEANAMMMPPQANVSGGQMYMQRGSKGKTVVTALPAPKPTKDEEMLDRMHLSAMTSKNRNKAFRDLHHNTDYNLLLNRLRKAGSSTRGSKGKSPFQPESPSEIDDAEIGLAIKSKSNAGDWGSAFTTGKLETMTDAQITSNLNKAGLTDKQIQEYLNSSNADGWGTDYTASLPTVSKREGGMAMGGDGVVGQLQQLGGQAADFANSVQSTIGGGGGGQSGPLQGFDTFAAQREPLGLENTKPLNNMQSRLEQGSGMGGRGALAFGPQSQIAASQIGLDSAYNQNMGRGRGSSFGSSLGSYLPFLFQTGSDGMVVDDAMSGVMSVASPQAQDALAERMAVSPPVNQPQNPEERAIYDGALLALQGMLEGEAAQMAIDEFIETFGAEAYRMLEELVANESENGGIVQPANGETTVAEGEIQGPDVIPGKIVDPVTGEQTANLRVGENEYIEPADSLERRAMAAGLPPSPQNGAMVRGEEEKQLEAMYG